MNRTNSALALGAILALPIAPAFGQQLRLLPKQVCAPPADILDGTVRLPELGDVAIESRYARIPVALEPMPTGALEWTGHVPIDDGATVRMMLLHPSGAPLAWEVTPPPSAPRGAVGPAAPSSVERADIEGFIETPIAEMRTFPVAPSGEWTVRVRAEAGAPRDGGGIAAWLFVASDSPHALTSSVDTLNHIPGGAATITADLRTDAGGAQGATVTSAIADVDGRAVEMLDDGAHGDGAAGDGLYGVTIPLQRVGPVQVRIEATGITEGGAAFVRTVEHRIEVAPGGITLAPGAAFAEISADPGAGQSQVRIDIPAAFEAPGRRVLVAAELWGVDPVTREPEPATWAAMITEPRALQDGSSILSLFVDRRWMATESVVGPFELRNVRVHDVDTFVPVAVRERVPAGVHGELELPAARPRATDPAMVHGVPRADLALATTLSDDDLGAALSIERAAGAHNLMLSHGYCAGGSPWPPANFTGFTEAFGDPNQNRTHDQFAQLLLAFGNGSKSHGIVAHSQGGCASLHLWTFYFSGLDWATGPRVIQSVGTPYQGTPLASLGGFSCGVNNNMTPAGAAAWLSTIPNAERGAVWYWTTSPSGSWCDFFANFILSSPNDGVVEVSRGQLPGANNMGNKTAWCHTTGMSNPAHYTDTTRNTEMDTNAAR